MQRDVIEWDALSALVGCEDNGACGSAQAHRALAEVLSENEMQRMVELYLSSGSGAHLVYHVFWVLQPDAAAEYCYHIFRTDSSLERRRAAVSLIKVAATKKYVAWVDAFWSDPDEGIQNWGADFLDQLCWSGSLWEEEAESYLKQGERHANTQVRDRVGFIRRLCASRRDEEGT